MDLIHGSWPEPGLVASVSTDEGRMFYLISEWNNEVWYFQRLATDICTVGRPPYDDFLLGDRDAQQWILAVNGTRVEPTLERTLLDLNEV